jgi:CRP/FNR family cyclic AMP-dependent transcriptional regulator
MKSILVIEDNQEILENTAEILELAAYKVYTASNGKAGIEIALENIPDLIICDVKMPVLDGFGTLQEISKIPKLQKIPFIFLSAKTEQKEIKEGILSGADDYLLKPFDEADLIKAIEAKINKSR